MIRRASFPLISVWVALALAGWPVIGAPTAWAQQQRASQQDAQPAPAAPQGPLDERILRLEQRILDLQTVIGTLQTFVRDGGGVPPQQGFPPAGSEGGGVTSGGGPSELSIRVLALETQIKALTTQMEQVASRLDQVNPGAGVPPLPGASPPLAQDQQFGAPPAGGPLGQSQSQRTPGSLRGHDLQSSAPGFSTGTAGPPLQNPFADPGPMPQAQSGLQVPQAQAGVQLQPQPFPPSGAPGAGAPGAAVGARAAYDASYQSFLRSDFQRAGNGFESFIKAFPNDELISNAYFWLGRTHYARRQYEPAAKAFLAGYKKNKKNSIAPDALLHLGMSLGAMGEKEAACSTLGAIAKQFPNAPDSLKQDVGQELKRARCRG